MIMNIKQWKIKFDLYHGQQIEAKLLKLKLGANVWG